jgi:N6-L-threonylcarbamoyladenine synthase
MKKQALEYYPRTLIVAGGVACNSVLQKAAKEIADDLDLPVYFPSAHLSTDNAAMIAAAGHFHFKRGERSGLDLTADVTIRLQNVEVEDQELRRKKVRYKL